MKLSMPLIWYFASIHLIFLLSMPKNVAHLEFNVSVQEKMRCIEKERVALLSFKQRLVDEYDILSSWDADVNTDCCNWRGVECSNATTSHHIIGLDLHGSEDYQRYLMGEVGSSLTQLSHLKYLDLSLNRFGRIVLEDIASLMDLNYLNLSYNLFATLIPPHLGNLSKLSVLDLRANYWLNHNFRWLISSTFSSLNYLDLSLVDFRGADDWAIAINKLPMLQSLFLINCGLPTPILSSHYSNTNFSRFLVELDLSMNHINFISSNYYSWIINLTNLVHLNLGYNNLQGSNFDDFENMTSLVFLGLTFTQVNFRSLKPFGSLFNLKSLYLSANNIGGLLSDFLKAFPPRVLHSFQDLDLAANKFNGSLPDFTMFPSLKGLNLFDNMLSGAIPQNLGQLSNLEFLGLGNNFLMGEVSETHFSKLTHLKVLDLSTNPNLNLNFNSDWVPPFQLVAILLRSIKLGPLFPKWFRTQNFSSIDISFAEISGIIPHWFWTSLSPNLLSLDLSGNKIMGEIPDLSVKFRGIDHISLNSNKFVGQIPSFLFQSHSLRLSNNTFSDLTTLCQIFISPLMELDLSNNQLSGQLPNCWDSVDKLIVLKLSDNFFVGDLPHSMSKLIQLNSLILRNNQFCGGLDSLSNLHFLKVIDVMNNNLSGAIPSWIGSKLPNLSSLNLKSNKFHGNLPSSICNLKHIQVLDISSNNVSGSVPTCIHNFQAFKQTLEDMRNNDFYYNDYVRELAMIQKREGILMSSCVDLVMMLKGKERLITGEPLSLERSIDLSCNHLTGKIPDEITQLVGLITLNLSSNELTGPIPSNMGQLQLLEVLDLSRNRLYGPIPATLSQISTLASLDLSYNNLSGKIPRSTQLQSFPNSSYEGNPYLCGDPLKKGFDEIPPEPNINNNVHVDNGNENEDSWFVLREFFISMTFGYIVGFWGIFGSLILRRRWRHGYFKFLRNTFH